jgi:hypothetical protein
MNPEIAKDPGTETADWFCYWCDKAMSEKEDGYARGGICYCSKECADEYDWNK